MDWRVVANFLYILLAFGLAILLVLLLWLLRYRRLAKWQKQYESEAQRLRLHLRRMSRNLEEFKTRAARYSPDDPEPYQPAVRELHQKLAVMSEIQAHQARQFEAPFAPPSPDADHLLAQFYTVFGPEYRLWQRRYRNLKQIEKSGRKYERERQQAEVLYEQLRDLPLQVARRAQKLDQDIGTCLQTGHGLLMTDTRAHSVGPTVNTVEQLRAELRTLPVYFFQESENLITQQARKEDIIRAWTLLARIQPCFEEAQAALNDWLGRYKVVEQALGKLEQQAQTTLPQLSAINGSINSNSLTARLEQARNRAYQSAELYLAGITKTSAQFSKDVAGSGEVIELLGKRARVIQQDFSRLAQLFREVKVLLPQLETRLREESRAKKYADWDPLQARLAELHQSETSIAELKPPWTPEQLTEYLERVNRLHRAATEFGRRLQEAQTYAPKLKSLLAEPVLASSVNWFARVAEVQGKIGVYNQADWPAEYNIPHLQSDAKILVSRRQKLLSGYGPDRRLPIDRLKPASVDEVRRLIDDLGEFQKRLDAIDSKAAALQEKKRVAQRQLKDIREAVDRLAHRWAELEFLGQLPVSRQYSRWARWVQESYNGSAFNPGRRKISTGKQASAVDKWAKSCLKRLQPLLQALQDEIKTTEKNLIGEVKKLQDLAWFDREPVLQPVQALLREKRSSHIPHSGATPKNRPDKIIHLIDHVAAGRLTELKALYEARQKLEAEITTPVSQGLARLEQLQQEISLQITQFKELKKKPDVDSSLLDEHINWAEKTMGQIRRKREALKSGRTVPEVLACLGEVNQHYEGLLAELGLRLQEITEQAVSLQQS